MTVAQDHVHWLEHGTPGCEGMWWSPDDDSAPIRCTSCDAKHAQTRSNSFAAAIANGWSHSAEWQEKVHELEGRVGALEKRLDRELDRSGGRIDGTRLITTSTTEGASMLYAEVEKLKARVALLEARPREAAEQRRDA